MAGEQHGLLGVGAKAADDDERYAVALGGGVHTIEGGRDIRSHRLALAVRERPAVLPRAGRPERDVGRRGQLGFSACAGPYALARTDLDGVAHLDAHADGGELSSSGNDTPMSCAPLLRAVASAARRPRSR